MPADTPDFQRALFEIDLKEVEIVFAQGHTRMAIVGQYTNVSVTLAGAIAATLATLTGVSRDIPSLLYLVIPFPFLMFAFLILREDFLMVHHDFYLYRLRQRLLERLDRAASDPALRFLSDIKAAKIGSIAGLATVLSALRYGVPLFVAVPCLIWYVWLGGWSWAQWTPWRSCLFLLNIVLLALLATGVFHLGNLHKLNESLVPQGGRSVG